MALTDPVRVYSGVGPKRVLRLASLGIQLVGDVLFYFPFRTADLMLMHLAAAAAQEKQPIMRVVVAAPVISRFGPHRSREHVKLLLERSELLEPFYNQPWLMHRFQMGDVPAVFGCWDAQRRSLLGMCILATQSQDQPSMAAI